MTYQKDVSAGYAIVNSKCMLGLDLNGRFVEIERGRVTGADHSVDGSIIDGEFSPRRELSGNHLQNSCNIITKQVC